MGEEGRYAEVCIGISNEWRRTRLLYQKEAAEDERARRLTRGLRKRAHSRPALRRLRGSGSPRLRLGAANRRDVM